jgi:hypothetical protein
MNMVTGLLKRLSQQQVPPPPSPETFDSELNTRLNHRLLISLLVDLVGRAIPYTFLEFSRAAIGFAKLTLTGHWPGERRRRR